jgi:hypothetical protein
MTKLLVMLAVLASVQGSSAPPKPEPGGPRQLADDAMKFVAADDMKGLFAFIAAHMPSSDRESIDAIRDSSVDQRKKLSAALGKSQGVVFIRECRLSDLVRIVYLEKREKNALRWQFIFFRPRTAWVLSSFNWDANLDSLFAPCD